jgi:hypothetical protein
MVAASNKRRKSMTIKKPSHRAYSVQGEGTSRHWICIGAAWQNQDKKGFAVKLDALPVDGYVLLRVPKDEPAKRR